MSRGTKLGALGGDKFVHPVTLCQNGRHSFHIKVVGTVVKGTRSDVSGLYVLAILVFILLP